MTIASIKSQLHDFIDHADEKKVMALYELMQHNQEAGGVFYDAQTVEMLEQRFTSMINEPASNLTLQQTIANMKLFRQQHGL